MNKVIIKKDQEIHEIKKKLEENFYKFKPGTRVKTLHDINDFVPTGDNGTVVDNDIMGTIHVVWDKNLYYMQFEFDETDIMVPISPQEFSIKQGYDFNKLISYLRCAYQNLGLYIEGATETLDFEECEAIINFSLDIMLKENDNYFSFVATYNDDNKTERIDIGIYDRENEIEIPITDYINHKEVFINSEINEETLKYLSIYKKEIEQSLFDKAVKENLCK